MLDCCRCGGEVMASPVLISGQRKARPMGGVISMTNETKDDFMRAMMLGRRQLLQAAGAGLAGAALSGLASGAQAQEKVELTLWAWTPNTQAELDLFAKAFPNITVKLENAGQG